MLKQVFSIRYFSGKVLQTAPHILICRYIRNDGWKIGYPRSQPSVSGKRESVHPSERVDLSKLLPAEDPLDPSAKPCTSSEAFLKQKIRVLEHINAQDWDQLTETLIAETSPVHGEILLQGLKTLFDQQRFDCMARVLASSSAVNRKIIETVMLKWPEQAGKDRWETALKIIIEAPRQNLQLSHRFFVAALSCAQPKEARHARRLLREMPAKYNIYPDQRCFNLVLQLYLDRGLWQQSLELVRKMGQRNIHFDDDKWNPSASGIRKALLDICNQTSTRMELLETYKLLDSCGVMLYRRSLMYKVYAYLDTEDVKTAFIHFNNLHESNQLPPAHLYSAVFKACIDKDLGYQAWAALHAGTKTWDELKTQSNYFDLAQIMAKSKKWSLVLRTYEWMQVDLKSNTCIGMLKLALKGCYQTKNIQLIPRLVTDIIMLDVKLWNGLYFRTVIDALITLGKIDEAFELFDHQFGKGLVSNPVFMRLKQLPSDVNKLDRTMCQAWLDRLNTGKARGKALAESLTEAIAGFEETPKSNPSVSFWASTTLGLCNLSGFNISSACTVLGQIIEDMQQHGKVNPKECNYHIHDPSVDLVVIISLAHGSLRKKHLIQYLQEKFVPPLEIEDLTIRGEEMRKEMNSQRKLSSTSKTWQKAARKKGFKNPITLQIENPNSGSVIAISSESLQNWIAHSSQSP